ncbi:MAG: putative bifunctional diguanylate cyclase/phosphodiesterase [Gemmatimonadaceae bacterium]
MRAFPRYDRSPRDEQPDVIADARLRRYRRVVLATTLLATLAVVARITLVWQASARSAASRTLLAEVQAQAHRQNALKWRAIAEGRRPSAAVAAAAAAARLRATRALAQLAEHQDPATLATLQGRLTRFEDARRVEFQLLSAGLGGRARALDRAVVSPEFVALQAEIGALSARYAVEASDAERDALLGSLAAALVATAVVALLFSLYGRARRRAEALAAREAALLESEARFRSLVQHGSDAVLVLDRRGTVSYASPASARVLGSEPGEISGRPLSSVAHEEDVEKLADAVALWAADQAEGGAAWGEEAARTLVWRVRDRSGRWRHVESVGSNLLNDSAVRGLVLNTRDVTERVSLEARLIDQAYSDPLTRLANRALFRRRVEHAISRAERPHERVAAIFIDLDKFKTVNDSLGHDQGDALLALAAERLLNATRGIDTVARLGGDEFAVLLENVLHDEDAARVAQRVVAALREPFTLEGREVVVGASVGVARARADDTAEALLRNADVAMYVAKAQGGNGYQVFRPEMHAAVLERLELEAQLRQDVNADRLDLAYQPIVDLETGDVVGVEALARWTPEGRGPVTPATFIPIAEETGLIVPLGRWVLRTACRALAAWRAELAAAGDDRALSLSVNLSARQLVDAGIVSVVAESLAESGLPAECLTLEITESVLMSDTELMLERLQALKQLGVQLALDDFGTGYSSLSYLQRFPIDLLKIDRAFTQGTTGTPEEMALADAVLQIGSALGMHTVAEGIELPAQIEHLRGHGCELGQGFLFSPPVPRAAVEALLAKRGHQPRPTPRDVAAIPATTTISGAPSVNGRRSKPPYIAST